MKRSILLVLLLFSHCEILEVPRVPLISPPLGLQVFKTGTTAASPFTFAVRFEAYNTEAFFSGWRIYIATSRADLERINPEDPRFALAPTGSAILLSNFNAPNDTNVSISFAGAMTAPSRITYPQNASISTGSVLSTGGFGDGSTIQTGITPIPAGTYFIGVYSYSIGDNVYSLPSIATLTLP